MAAKKRRGKKRKKTSAKRGPGRPLKILMIFASGKKETRSGKATKESHANNKTRLFLEQKPPKKKA